MKKYDILYILRPTLTDEARQAAIDGLAKILTDNGAKILDTNTKDWGLRDLAYEIKKETKGYYVLLKVEAEIAALKEFGRQAAYNKTLLRYLATNSLE